ncbi:hypothetical protein NTGZN8_100025 [Candidatus Nitrotoga fabula]|uniref:Uncharacterized protein n=1 Tax=Candidatus Nitrotoga fabula TaxID=2182327 RepID=A0A916BAJ9_9PROT|nr:hypothetical protein NTGZN8_100025 [Candidatus Nitrotoga fabula]
MHELHVRMLYFFVRVLFGMFDFNFFRGDYNEKEQEYNFVGPLWFHEICFAGG